MPRQWAEFTTLRRRIVRQLCVGACDGRLDVVIDRFLVLALRRGLAKAHSISVDIRRVESDRRTVFRLADGAVHAKSFGLKGWVGLVVRNDSTGKKRWDEIALVESAVASGV